MNCKQVRRFLYSFADGELTVKDNCDVLDHLKMCPTCAGTVADQQALRKSLGASMQSVSMPPHLLSQIQSAIAAEKSAQPAPVRIIRFSSRWAALAACLTIGATAGYLKYGRHGAPQVPSPVSSVAVADEVIATHDVCCHHTRAAHQARDLPDTLEGLRDAVATRFGPTLEVNVPDLSDSGFKFDSANFCGVERGRRGLHLIYASQDDGAKLSFFSVPRCTLNCKGFCNRGHRAYYVDVREHQGVKFTVVGWQCSKGRSSFLACAPVPEQKMLDLLEAVRMAGVIQIKLPNPATQLALLDFSQRPLLTLKR